MEAVEHIGARDPPSVLPDTLGPQDLTGSVLDMSSEECKEVSVLILQAPSVLWASMEKSQQKSSGMATQFRI